MVEDASVSEKVATLRESAREGPEFGGMEPPCGDGNSGEPAAAALAAMAAARAAAPLSHTPLTHSHPCTGRHAPLLGA